MPAYNEEVSLPLLLQSISELSFPGDEWHVVVVDDGSSDSTPLVLRDWAARIPMTVLTHSPNQGLGAAMRTGLAHIAGVISEGDAVVAMDSDNTHPPSLAVRMREKQKAEDLDIVIASRYASENGESGQEVGLASYRKLLSRGAGLLLQWAFHIKGARDYTCGYRLYSSRIIRKAWSIYGTDLVEENSFVCMAEILIKLARIGARIGEVPLVLRYDLKGGASKMKVMRTVMRYLGLIWQYKVRGSLRRFPAC